MYAVINEMDAVQGSTVGSIYSKHRTLEACAKAMAKTQRAVKRGNGQNSYLPLKVVRLTTDYPVNTCIGYSNCEPITDSEYDQLLDAQLR